jgi:hypothetical protein
LVFITVLESVYSAVRTESLYKTDKLGLSRVEVKITFYRTHSVYQNKKTAILTLPIFHATDWLDST